GTSFRNATEVTMNGSDCVTILGARWLSPASDPKILAQVECWPAVLVAHLATSRGMALEDWWGAGTAPLLVIQGLDDEAAPPGNGHALREQFGERVRLSTYLVRDIFCCWSSPKPLPAPLPSLSALRSLALTACEATTG